MVRSISKFNAYEFLRVGPLQDLCLPQSGLKRTHLKNSGNYKQNTISHDVKSHQNSGETESSNVFDKMFIILSTLQLSLFIFKFIISYKFIILKKLFL